MIYSPEIYQDLFLFISLFIITSPSERAINSCNLASDIRCNTAVSMIYLLIHSPLLLTWLCRSACLQISTVFVHHHLCLSISAITQVRLERTILELTLTLPYGYLLCGLTNPASLHHLLPYTFYFFLHFCIHIGALHTRVHIGPTYNFVAQHNKSGSQYHLPPTFRDVHIHSILLLSALYFPIP